MKIKLTNKEAQMLYWAVEDDQFRVNEGGNAHKELLKIVADNPYKNGKFRPEIDTEILGYYIAKEMTGLAEHMAEYEDYTPKELGQYFDFAAKYVEFIKPIENRFKILWLLALAIGVWEDKMQELGDKLDQNHPDAVEALGFYESKIIEVVEAKDRIKRT